MALPAPLPVLAAIAGVGGWLVGRRAASAEAAAAAAPPSTATPDATAASPTDATSSGWASAQLQWGDQGSGAGVLNGVMPGSNPGASVVGGDALGDGGSILPGPAPGPAPAPAPGPAPAPSGTYVYRPSSVLTGVAGWIVAVPSTSVYDAPYGWSGAFPVKVTGPRALGLATTGRWASYEHAGVLAGRSITLRRMGSGSGWSARQLLPGAGLTIYPATTARVRIG